MDLSFSTWALKQGYLFVIAGFLTAGLVMAALVFQLYVQLRSKRVDKSVGVEWKTKWPHSPPSLPILGHLHLLGAKPHISLHKLSLKYGPIFHMRNGATHCIVVSSPGWARQVLKVQDKAFCSRAVTSAAVEIFGKHGRDLAGAAYGPHWRHMRKLCMLELFTAKRIGSYEHIRDNETRSMVQSIHREEASTGKPLTLAIKVRQTILNAVSLMSMGKRLTQLGGENGEKSIDLHEFLENIYDIFQLTGLIDVPGDHFPSLRWMDIKGYEKKMKNASKKFDAYMCKMIQSKRSTKVEDGATKDILDVLLSLDSEGGLSGKLSDDIVTATMLDILSAGTDTSSITVEWAFVEMIKVPEKIKKVQQEIDAVVGKERAVMESDLINLPYLEAIIKETLRLHPPVPLLIPHTSIEACQIEDGEEKYSIPPKTCLYINAWSIGRNPAVWEDPMAFYPERFIETAASSIDLRGKDFELIPFGSGRRMCPGISLGLLSTKFTMARLLHSFDFSLIPGQKAEDIDMAETFGLTLTKTNSLQLMTTARDSAKFYL